jgi:hypothetical protein
MHYLKQLIAKARRWRLSMLRVECQDIGDIVTLRLEGRLVGEFAKDARELVTRRKSPPRLLVNLSEVTFVDGVGEDVLLWLARIGGEFVAENCYPLHVCERLHLPMAPKCARALPRGDVTRSQTFLDLRISGDGDPQRKGAKCHANTGKAKSNSKGPESGRGGQ